MINLLKLLHLLTLFYISDALFKRQNSLVRSNRLYGESTGYIVPYKYTYEYIRTYTTYRYYNIDVLSIQYTVFTVQN